MIPKGVAHVNGIISVAFLDSLDLLSAQIISSSLIGDFYIRTTGSSNLHSKWGDLPLITANSALLTRTLALNCLTTHYADLWTECWDDAFRDEQWLIPSKEEIERMKEENPALHPSSFILHPSSFILHPSSFILILSPLQNRETDYATVWAKRIP